MNSKLQFMKKAFLWTAIFSAIVIAVVGIVRALTGAPLVEETLGQEIAKYVVMWVWVTVILECFTYTLGQVAYHWQDENKEKYGKRWFIEGIKDDFRYIKEQITWKKVFKTIGIYVLFFAALFAIFGLLELIFP